MPTARISRARPTALCRAAVAMAFAASLGRPLVARDPESSVPGWRGLNPDMLSGGLYAALSARGFFGPLPEAPRARAGHADLSKGKPSAILDARVGANVRLGDDPPSLPPTQRGQAEPHVTRSAVFPNVLLATFQEGRFAAGGGSVNCGYAVSRDGGLTWTRDLTPRLTQASGGPYLRATDPVAAVGPQGDLYLNALASIDDGFGLSAVVVSRSLDTGATWSEPIIIFQSPNTQIAPDKNWLVANEFADTATRGRLVCTWTNFTGNAAGVQTGNNIVASFSDDRGASWSASIAVTPAGSSNQGSLPLFLPDGSLVLVYVTFLNPNNAAQFRVDCKRSSDGGRTFPAAATTIASVVNGWDDPEMREGVFLPSGAVARQTGELFVCYTALVNASPRVVVTRSADSGTTWSAPVVVSDQPEGGSVMNPAVTVTPDGRTVSVVFMDKRNAPGGRGFVDHYLAQSFDGGATWQPNLRLTELSSDIRYGTLTPTGVMLGDYIGIAPSLSNEQPCVAIWCDTRTGDADPFVARFAPAAVPDYGAWAVARGLRPSPALIDIAADPDADGESNYLEFIAGTDPNRAESGENLVIRRSTPGTVDVMWTERSGIQKFLISDGVSIASARNLGMSRPFSLSASISGNLPDRALPALALPPGLAWHGARFVVAPEVPIAIARSLKYSAGLPVTASTMVTTSGTDARLANVSTRGLSGIGSSQLIVGFAIDGRKSVLLRAAGPALTDLGVSGALADPRLSLAGGNSGSAGVGANDNWSQGNATSAVFAQVGAFPFVPDSLDAALLETLPTGSYTVITSGSNSITGVALVEAYDADVKLDPSSGPRFVNLSTRGNVAESDGSLIAGFVVSGTQPRRMLLRAIGPSLAQFGVDGFLADPKLALFQGAVQIASNDDWEISRSAPAIAATAQQVGAFPLNSASLDAALLITLAPGAYTVIVTGVDGRTGITLVEIYDAD